MNIIPYLLNFPIIWGISIVLVHRMHPSDDDSSSSTFRESLVCAGLIFSFEVWVFTEGLSCFRILTASALAAVYLLSVVFFGGLLILYRSTLFQAIRSWRSRPGDTLIRRTVAAVCLLVGLPLFLLALFDPPSTLDSMTYHMPRVVQWMENRNVEPYPSGEPRQIFLPPLGDYFFLHWYLLAGNDYYVNTVQFTILIGIFFLASLLAQRLGFDSKIQLLSALFVLLVPTLLAESAQPLSDAAATFFFLSFLYFGLKSIRSPRGETHRTCPVAVFFMGLSLSLGINVKMTVAMFALPFCCWFGFLYLVRCRFKAIPLYLLLAFLFLLVNTPFFARNYHLCGTLYGDVELHQMAANAAPGPKAMISNFLRVFGFQLMTPLPAVNDFNIMVMKGIHELFAMGWNNPETTFRPWPDPCYDYHSGLFPIPYALRNKVAVFLLFTSVVSSVCFFPFARKNGNDDESRSPTAASHASWETTLYVLLVFAGFMVYGALVRWSPYSPRLTVPGLVAFAPYCAYAVARLFHGKGVGILATLAVLIGTWYTSQLLYEALSFSPRKMFLTKANVLPQERVEQIQADLNSLGFKGRLRYHRDFQPATDGNILWYPEKVREIENRSKPLRDRLLDRWNLRYFAHQQLLFVDALLIAELAERLERRDVGLWIASHLANIEYPLGLLHSPDKEPIRVRWVFYPEYVEKMTNYRADYVPELIVIDNVNKIPQVLEEYELGDIHTHFQSYFIAEVVGKKRASPRRDADDESSTP